MPADKPAKRPDRKPEARKPIPQKPTGKPRKPQGKPVVKPASGADEPLRIAKAMARAGLCSRREAERWISQGRVNVNGRVLTTPAFEVTAKDKVLIDGKHLPTAEPPRLWRYYKPRGLVTTHNDPQGRPTVFESLPEGLPRVISVGRLDFNSEGLLLLTNDGALARHMELPSTGWLRRYRVRVHGRVSQQDLDTLKDGVEVEGVRYGPIEATLDSVQSGNAWLTMALREGKNREVRRILAHLGVEVNRLIRISYGPFQLLDLKPGDAESVKRRVIADQLGARLAEELNLDAASDEEQRAKRKGTGIRRRDKDA
jgi:23S rRNA pseudouridine2605 synthase